MRQSTRLILNTAITYGRMVLTVGIGLVITRLAFHVLGPEDFGLLTLLGATGSFLLVITGSLNSSAQRHLAYEIGRNNSDRVRVVFNTSLILFAGLSVLVALIGGILGPWIITWLKIPHGRERESLWVYEFAVAGLSLSFAGTPFRGLFIAHQEMLLSAVFDILDVLLKLTAVILLILLPSSGDKLVLYAGLLFAALAVTQTVSMLLCLKRFPESRPKLRLFDRSELRPLAQLAGWSFLGSVAYQIAMQSSDIILNLFFFPLYGTVVNAAYAVAMQISSYQASLGGVISRTAAPALVGVEARGDRANVRLLTISTGKWAALITLFYLVPLQFEAEYLLRVWLGKRNDFASLYAFAPIFVRLVLLWMWISVYGTGFNLASFAINRVGVYTIVMCGLLFGSLGVALLVLWLGAPPWALPAVTVGGGVIILIFQAAYIGRLINLPFFEWFRRAVLPVAMVSAMGVAIAMLIHFQMREGFLRLLAVGFASAVIMAGMIWLTGMDPAEKQLIHRLTSAAWNRLRTRQIPKPG